MLYKFNWRNFQVKSLFEDARGYLGWQYWNNNEIRGGELRIIRIITCLLSWYRKIKNVLHESCVWVYTFLHKLIILKMKTIFKMNHCATYGQTANLFHNWHQRFRLKIILIFDLLHNKIEMSNTICNINISVHSISPHHSVLTMPRSSRCRHSKPVVKLLSQLSLWCVQGMVELECMYLV